jgi:hypothetical protein
MGDVIFLVVVRTKHGQNPMVQDFEDSNPPPEFETTHLISSTIYLSIG